MMRAHKYDCPLPLDLEYLQTSGSYPPSCSLLSRLELNELRVINIYVFLNFVIFSPCEVWLPLVHLIPDGLVLPLLAA